MTSFINMSALRVFISKSVLFGWSNGARADDREALEIGNVSNNPQTLEVLHEPHKPK